jgi:hypothetical protein
MGAQNNVILEVGELTQPREIYWKGLYSLILNTYFLEANFNAVEAYL